MLKYLVRGLVVGAACAGVFGCSGDDDDSESPQPDPAAVAKCDDFLAAYSLAVVDCGVAAGTIPEDERDDTLDDVRSEAEKTLDCSRTVRVGDTYDACMDWLRDPDCDMIIEGVSSMGESPALPDECNSVIYIF
jgi:hypothetical protein